MRDASQAPHSVASRTTLPAERIPISSIYGCDTDLRCTWCDPQPDSPWNSDAIGCRDDELFEPASAAALMQVKRDALNTQAGVRRVLRITIAGQPYQLDVRVEPQISEGRVVGLIVVVVDVSGPAANLGSDRLLAMLDDAARRAGSSDAVLTLAARRLAEHLGATRCVWARIEPTGRTFVIDVDHDRLAGATTRIGTRYATTTLSVAARASLRAGRPWVVNDVATHVPASAILDACRHAGIGAIACAPARRAGRLVGVLAALADAPRRWSHEDLALMGRVAERCCQAADRAELERDLRDSKAQFRVALDNVRLGTWERDLTTGLITCSQQLRADLGLAPNETLHFDQFVEMIAPADREAVRSAVTRAIIKGSLFQAEYDIVRRDGQRRRILSSGRVTDPVGGTPTRLIGVAVDVTDQRSAEATQLERLDAERHARRELERIGRLKDDFLATLAHELRTPLNAVLGWAQMLRRRPYSPSELDTGLATIERNVRHQVSLVEDLLDMSRIVSGKVRLDARPISTATAIADAIEGVRAAADARRVCVSADTVTEDATILADASRVQQVLLNLLTNAVKFTPPDGRVDVSLDVQDNVATIAVRDTGRGIEPHFLPFVFDRFRQAEGEGRRSKSGLGLGLSIVRSLVELHGGDVRAHSDGPDRGATFFVTLPLAPINFVTRAPISTQSSPTSNPPPRLGGATVLIVDDDADARELIRRLLAEQDAITVLAADADTAIACLDDMTPALLISDVGMPDRDGYDLIRTIRARADDAARIPAMALTAFTRATDRNQALAAGFDAYLTKPVDAVELIATCEALIGR